LVLCVYGVKTELQSSSGCCEAGRVLFVAEENLQLLPKKLLDRYREIQNNKMIDEIHY